jgi:hypothetical protein
MLQEREALRQEVMRLRAEMMAAGLDPDPQQLALTGMVLPLNLIPPIVWSEHVMPAVLICAESG